MVALRTIIAAIDNAGSVDIPQGSDTLISGKPKDVPRRELTAREAVELLRREVDESDAGIRAAQQHGNEDRAGELRARRGVLAAYV